MKTTNISFTNVNVVASVAVSAGCLVAMGKNSLLFKVDSNY